jgi:hypothetical protein
MLSAVLLSTAEKLVTLMVARGVPRDTILAMFARLQQHAMNLAEDLERTIQNVEAGETCPLAQMHAEFEERIGVERNTGNGG